MEICFSETHIFIAEILKLLTPDKAAKYPGDLTLMSVPPVGGAGK